MDHLSDLYLLPAAELTYAIVRDFVLLAEEIDGLTESMTIELKAARHGRNIVEAVQGFANADGGLVLVGTSETHRGEDRLIGIPAREHDAIVSQLRESLGNAMPEVIAVAVPGDPERLIVVLRVDADATPTPVVVRGRVMIRLPGQTVPARRDDIIRLVHKNEASTERHRWRRQPPMVDPGNIPLWLDNNDPCLTIKVYGGLVLPSRVLSRPRLSTAAYEAARSALAESPLPGRIWAHKPDRRALSSVTNRWTIAESTSTRLRLRSDSEPGTHDASRPEVPAMAYLTLANRLLEVLVGIGVNPSIADPGHVPELTVTQLHEALLAGLSALHAAAAAMARALGADNPRTPLDAQAWLQPREHMPFTPMLDLSRWAINGDRHLPSASFGPTPISSTIDSKLNTHVTEWLATLLLDHGATSFERDLEQLKLPEWAKPRES